jgi:hypothetical protein
MAIGLLSIGVLVGGVLEIADALAAKESSLTPQILNRLYSPFLYFLFATATLHLWIGRVGKGAGSVVALGIASAVFYAAYAGIVTAMPPQNLEKNSLLEELLVGRWNLLQMGSISLFGAAIGKLIQLRIESGGKLSSTAPLGGMMIAGAVIASIALGASGHWFEHPKSVTLFTAFFYSGIALVVISLFRSFSERIRSRRALRLTADIICCIGILLFPLFVLQSTVYLSAAIWQKLTGGPFLIMLASLIVLFSIAAGLLVRKVYKIYYDGRK